MSDVNAACRLAEHLAEVDRYAEAERIVRAALRRAPNNAELLTMLGYLLRMQQRYVDALAACDVAVASAPGHGAAHAQRAWVLIGIHRTGQAIEAATEAVRLDPRLADRHLVLAEALLQDDRVDEARETVREALRLAPRSVSALLTLAEIERSAGNTEAAATAARRALAIDPADTRGRRLLALLDADRGAVRRSMRTLAEVARDRPTVPDLDLLVWPIRRVVVAPRWWLAGSAGLVAAAGLLTLSLHHCAAVPRVAAVLIGAVTIGFLVRVLAPAGRLPWKALRQSPPLVRRSLGAGLAVIAVTFGLLAGYAAGGPLVLPMLAVLAAPLLWTCMIVEQLGWALDNAGDRQFLHDWRREFGEALARVRAWPAETRRDLHAAWHANDADERERKQRMAERRRPLAVYRNRQRDLTLCTAYGLTAVLAAFAATVGRPSLGVRIGLGLFALLTLYVSIRTAVMKVIATPDGLILDGPLWKAVIRWERVAEVIDDSGSNAGLIPTRAPTLSLSDGRRYRIKQAACYDFPAGKAAHHANTWVKNIAAELELIRRTYRTPPDIPQDPPTQKHSADPAS